MTVQRKIIHIDMDAFFAAIEMRDDPSLLHLPLAIGGKPEERSVICTANYIARKYGVRSAISSWKAKKLCPNLVLLPPNGAKYQQESEYIQAIIARYSDIIEPLSLDEAFIDVSNSKHCGGSATLIAQAIRDDILRERGLTASAGIASNKFLAKVASDWNKPNGQFVIPPHMVDKFMLTLPVEKIYGVGKVTHKRLLALGIKNCGDLQAYNILSLTQHFGKFGAQLYELSRGIDRRTVDNTWIRKSVSVEDTFAEDLYSLDECLAEIPRLREKLLGRFARLSEQYFIKKLFVRVRFADFTKTTAECSLFLSPNRENFSELMGIAFRRKNMPVRLLGLGMGLSQEPNKQLSFW